jgi:hypothetical protein
MKDGTLHERSFHSDDSLAVQHVINQQLKLD